MQTNVRILDELKNSDGRRDPTPSRAELDNGRGCQGGGACGIDMFGIRISYIPDDVKKLLERWDKMGQQIERYFDSLTSDQIEELMRKAIPEAYPFLHRRQIETCVAHEMKRIADRGRFSIYLTEDSRLTMRLRAHMPAEPWLHAPSDQAGTSGSPNVPDVNHPISE